MPVGHIDETTVKPKPKSRSDKKKISKEKKRYDTRKTLGIGLLDLTILLVHITLLIAVVDTGKGNRFFESLIVLLSVCLLLQIVVGVFLLLIGLREHVLPEDKRWLHVVNTTSMVLIIVITILNMVITILGVDFRLDGDDSRNTTRVNGD